MQSDKYGNIPQQVLESSVKTKLISVVGLKEQRVHRVIHWNDPLKKKESKISFIQDELIIILQSHWGNIYLLPIEIVSLAWVMPNTDSAGLIRVNEIEE